MQIRNNYDIMWKRADGLGAGTGIFNGDIGCITQIDFQQETMTVQFDEKKRRNTASTCSRSLNRPTP